MVSPPQAACLLARPHRCPTTLHLASPLPAGTYRPRQRGAAGRGGYGRAGAYYGGAAGAAGGAQYGAHHDPFASSYGENVGRGYWGHRNFGRRAGLGEQGARK